MNQDHVEALVSVGAGGGGAVKDNDVICTGGTTGGCGLGPGGCSWPYLMQIVFHHIDIA